MKLAQDGIVESVDTVALNPEHAISHDPFVDVTFRVKSSSLEGMVKGELARLQDERADLEQERA
eukprot:1356972-Amphidinium_carterae.3